MIQSVEWSVWQNVGQTPVVKFVVPLARGVVEGGSVLFVIHTIDKVIKI
jgi:hypothetical protein